MDSFQNRRRTPMAVPTARTDRACQSPSRHATTGDDSWLDDTISVVEVVMVMGTVGHHGWTVSWCIRLTEETLPAGAIHRSGQ